MIGNRITTVILMLILLLCMGLIIYLVVRVCSSDIGDESYPQNRPQYLNKLVPYDVSMCQSDLSTCLDTDKQSPNCQLVKSQRTQAFFGYKVNIFGTDPSVKGMNCSFKYQGTQLCKKDGTIHNWNDQGRPVLVYYPNSVLTQRGGDIPYVIYFSFTQWDTTKMDADSLVKAGGYGLFNPDRVNECTIGSPCGSSPTSAVWLQLQLQSFLSAGYAVVLTTMIGDDSYMYQETCPPPLKSQDSIYNLCWNKGDNPDASYLRALFKLIKSGNLLKSNVEEIPSDPTLGQLASGTKDFLKNPVKLDPDYCGLIGYSVGAQMVSRAINDFGTDTLPDSPRVSVGCMIAGGSLHCYEYCNGDGTTARGFGNTLCDQQPKDWGPCWNPESLGCCPAGLTEPRYDGKSDPKDQHPPVILVQTDFDYYADPRASENYYRALLKIGVKNTQIVHGLCGNHNTFSSAILPVLSFFKKNMQPTSYSTI